MSAGFAPGAPGQTASPALTPLFVRLKLALLRNGLRRSPGRAAAYVASILVGVVCAAGAATGLVLLRGVAHVDALVVLLTGFLTLGWAVMPLFFPSGDETLDPTRLVMLPLRPRPLIVALLTASLVGIGPFATLALATGAAVAVADGTAATVVAVCAVPLVVLVCVALARAVATASIRLLTSRRGRDLAVLGGLFVALGGQVVNIGAQKLGRPDGLSVLEPVGEVLRWVPPASAMSAVADAGQGAWCRAAVGLTLTVLALVLLLWWWQRMLTTLMTSPDASTLQAVEKDGGRAAKGGARGLTRLLPDGRTGAVMLRTLRYAWRDPKSKMSWATSLGMGLLVPVVYAAQGNGTVYTAFVAPALLGMQMYNQFGQDTSAFWMVAATLSTPRDAYRELRARALALFLVAVPYVTVVVVGTVAFLDAWSSLVEIYGLSLALLGALVATGALTSTLFPYSVPSDGNKNIGPGQASIAWFSLFGGLLAGMVLSAPLLALTLWLHLADHHGLLWILLPVGVVYGTAMAQAGLRIAAPLVVRRVPEILAAVQKG
ncbi:transporter [Streptomyces sp. NPDC059080]|uniref:transporter n=1 Tax=Streptomyces sp. NPDC059080 TaxID=3346718 RepID=UPI003678314A